jgi:hypothetical protein
MSARVFNLLLNSTSTSIGDVVALPKNCEKRTFQASVTGTGSVSASVDIQVSNDSLNFLTLATINLSGTTSATDGFVSDAPWAYVRASLTAISGTGASVSTLIGV